MSMFMVGMLGLAAVAACWILAFVLYRVGPQGSVARSLALLLLIEGITLITAGFPLMVLGIGEGFYEEHLAYAIAEVNLHHLGDVGMIVLYPIFLATVLRTRLTRPFTRRGVRITVAVLGFLLFVGTFISGATDTFWGMALLYVVVMLTFLFAFIASIHALIVAKPGVDRIRAGVFAAAFGIRDLCWGFAYGGSFWLVWTESFSMDLPLFWYVKIVYALGTLFAVPLIAYGTLRGYLFDIDLKVRWTIKQSTLAGIFVAIIFLVSEGASQLLSEELGSIPGLLAAAVLMFFLAPLQRFADRIAESAMPNTENTPEYVAFRKLQVYESAVSEALAEGGISAKERALLVHLRNSLGVSEADAESIERELAHPGMAA